MGSGFLKKKKDAKNLQSQMMQLQKSLSDRLEDFEAIGTAGNNLVSVVLTGNGELKKISINPECVDKDDIEGLETLIKAAHKEAMIKVQEVAASTPGFDSLAGLGF